MNRRFTRIALAVLTAAATAGALAITAAGHSAANNPSTLHLLLREDQQYIDSQPPAGPSAGDIVIIKGEVLDPATKQPVGYEGGHCTIVDASNEGREGCEIIFTPNALHAVAESDQITTQTFVL